MHGMVKYGDTRQFLLGFLALALILFLIVRYFTDYFSDAISPEDIQSLHTDSLRQLRDGVKDSTACDGGENVREGYQMSLLAADSKSNSDGLLNRHKLSAVSRLCGAARAQIRLQIPQLPTQIQANRRAD